MPSQRLRYEEPKEWSREEVRRALDADNPDGLLRAVIAVSMYEEDWEYAQDLCIRLAGHRHFNVRGNAGLGLDISPGCTGKLDREVVYPLIVAGLKDEDDHVRGHAFSAKDDTELFLGWVYETSEA